MWPRFISEYLVILFIVLDTSLPVSQLHILTVYSTCRIGKFTWRALGTSPSPGYIASLSFHCCFRLMFSDLHKSIKQSQMMDSFSFTLVRSSDCSPLQETRYLAVDEKLIFQGIKNVASFQCVCSNAGINIFP